jgi:hypothetical protein
MIHNLWDFTLNDMNVGVGVVVVVPVVMVENLSLLWHPLTPHSGGVKGSDKRH